MPTIEELEARVAKLEKSTSIWSIITGWLGNNPAFAHSLNAVASLAIGALIAWLSGLGGSVVTKEVPGPKETVIEKHFVPAKADAVKDSKIVDGPMPGVKPKE